MAACGEHQNWNTERKEVKPIGNVRGHFEHCVGTAFKNPLDALGIVLRRSGIVCWWNTETSCLDAAGTGASEHIKHVCKMQFIDQCAIDIMPWNIAIMLNSIIISKVFNLIQALRGYYPSDGAAIESQDVVCVIWLSSCSIYHAQNTAEVNNGWATRFHVLLKNFKLIKNI